LKLPLGFNSTGTLEIKEVLSISHLFISYFNNLQIREFLQQIINHSSDSLNQCLLVCKKENLPFFPPCFSVNSYIYDDPEKGNILYKNTIFSQQNQLLSKRSNQKKHPAEISLVLIDDIWKILPGLNKRNGGWLKNLLISGAENNIFLVIGGTLPYRNLLQQLMYPNKNPINSIGDEIIINPDDMIFFRNNNSNDFKSFYPEIVL
jgi:hypothetical protein